MSGDDAVDLECDDGVVTLSKAELSRASPYFKAMFTDGFTEQKQKLVRLHNVSQSDLKAMVQAGMDPSLLSDSQLLSVLTAAGMLQFEDVRRKCCQRIEDRLSPANCLLFLAYCDLLGEMRLYKHGSVLLQLSNKYHIRD